jgi:biopolymer transport protein ExbB/TolQ
MWSEIGNSIAKGDAYSILLLVFLFVGLVVCFERLFMLQFVLNLDFAKFLNNLKKMVKAEDFDRAISLCRNESKTSLPLISLRALEAAETDPSTVRGTIDEEAINFIPRIEARLGYLPALATLTMLVGVLGTIDALWNAFHSIDILDTAQKQASVGHGIAGSLTYTSIGLIVAMILLAAHQFLKGMAIRLAERIHYGVTVLTNLLAPQDVAVIGGAMMASPTMAMPMTESGGDMGSYNSGDSGVNAATASTALNNDSNEDGFDDASVEDIKDEEEII